jgi:hypothetical protein
METADYFRQKAAQCRRLAEGIGNQNDPVVGNLLTLAVEFEARAVALAAEEAVDTQIEGGTEAQRTPPRAKAPRVKAPRTKGQSGRRR